MNKVAVAEIPEDEMKDIGVQLVGSWFVATMQAFVDAAGSEEVLNSLRPYMRFHGNVGGLNMRNELGLTGSDATTIALAMQYGNMCARRLNVKSFKASSERAMGDILSCAFENAPQEVCEATCYLAGKGFCEGISAEHDFDLPYALGRGDPFCRYVIRKKSDSYSPEFENDKNMRTLPIPTIPQERIDFWGTAATGEWWTLTTNAFVDFAGLERAMEIIGPYMKQNGISFGLKYARELNVKARDATAIDSILTFMNSCLGQNGNVSQVSDERVEKEIYECPFSGAPAELCRQLEAFTNGMCEAINPDYELIHVRAMCRGDSSCIRLIRKKGTEEPVKKEVPEPRKESSRFPDNDLVRVLKMRLAKGEITEAEYDRLREKLSG
ncbi:MAG: SHOCT domain-containing protein [Methanomassiliicoccales archaeon]|nr:SHOCT domain-containing protein [Methanomassiliicoccales archaeon]